MRMEMKAKRIAAVAAMAMAAALAPRAQAQQGDLPSAREVIEKFIEVTGGREAYEKFSTRVTRGRVNVSVMDQAFSGTFTSYQSAPNLMYLRVDLGEFGTMERGTDGKVHWEIMTMTGARVFDGVEKAMAERESRFYRELELFDLYEKIEVKGEETFEGTAYYLLRMTPKTGDAEDIYFEKESGLLTAALTSQPTAIGDLPVWSDLTDYKAVDGLRLPHSAYQYVEEAGQTVEILTEEVEHDVEIPASRYELPAAIKALIGK